MLANFIKKYETKSGNFNYTLLTKPYGKYLIDETKPENIQFVSDIIKFMKEKNQDFGLAEKHQDNISEELYYDIDIVTENEISIDDKWIQSLVKEFNKVLIENVKSPDLTVCVCIKDLKSFKRTDGTYKLGLHIIYPFICFKTDERIYIYERIISNTVINNILKELNPIDDKIKEVIDHRVIYKNLILKFDCNKPNTKRYSIYKFYDSKLKEKEIEGDLSQVLSIRKNIWTTNVIDSELINEISITEEDTIEYTKTNSSQVNLEDIMILLTMFSKKRVSNYDDWIKVGLCLHNIDSSLDMMEIWKIWSEKCVAKSNITNFEREWSKFQKKNNGLHYGTLEFWAKEDNPTEFAKFKLDKLEKSIKNSLNFDYKMSPSATVIAKVLREKFFMKKYICSDIKGNRWWEFRDHYWVEIQEAYKLYLDINESLVKDYERQEIEIQSKILDLTSKKNLESPTEDQKAKIQIELEKVNNELKTLKKTIISLRKTAYKKELMQESKFIFYDETFETKLNETKHLLVFKNGVFDFNECVFRPGKPTDYMSHSTGINYQEYNSNIPETHRVMEIFSQIHPNETLRNFFFNTLALGLNGNQLDQKLDIWTGTGANGKSITVDFLSNSLGDYFSTPPITLLTMKRASSSNASPDLMSLKGVRIAIFQEPEHNDTLKTSILKQLTGGDYISGRELYQQQQKFKTQLKTFLACNDLPKIPTTDGGTWRRIRVLGFESKFVNEPIKPNEYKIDVRLQQEIPNLVNAFMSIIIEHYKMLRKKKFKYSEPNEVLHFTKEYKKDSDITQEFIDEHIENSDNEKDQVKCKDLYSIYTDWLRENYPGTKVININDFKRQMISKLGELPLKARGWKNYKLKIDDTYAI